MQSLPRDLMQPFTCDYRAFVKYVMLGIFFPQRYVVVIEITQYSYICELTPAERMSIKSGLQASRLWLVSFFNLIKINFEIKNMTISNDQRCGL